MWSQEELFCWAPAAWKHQRCALYAYYRRRASAGALPCPRPPRQGREVGVGAAHVQPADIDTDVCCARDIHLANAPRTEDRASA